MPRKRVAQDVLDALPELGAGHVVARLVQAKGNHLYEVELGDGTTTLCRMPAKFRNLVWVKRGDFVVTEINASNTKVCGDIQHILYPDQVKHLKARGQWPERFAAAPVEPPALAEDGTEALFENSNRRGYVETDEEDEDEDEDEEEDEGEERGRRTS